MMQITILGGIGVDTQRQPDGNILTVLIVQSPAGIQVNIPLDAQAVSQVIQMLKGHKPIAVVPAGAMPPAPPGPPNGG